MKQLIENKIQELTIQIEELGLEPLNQEIQEIENTLEELRFGRSAVLQHFNLLNGELKLLTTLLEKVDELEQELNPPIEPEIPNENEEGVEGGIDGEDEEAKEGEDV